MDKVNSVICMFSSRERTIKLLKQKVLSLFMLLYCTENKHDCEFFEY